MPVLAVEDERVRLDLALRKLVRAERVVLEPEHLVVRNRLLQERQPGRRLAPHPIRNAYAVSQAVGLCPRIRPERRLDLRRRRAGSLSLLRSAQAVCQIAAEQKLDSLFDRERDRRKVIPRSEPVALPGHSCDRHTGLAEGVDIAINCAHRALALLREISRAEGGFLAQPREDE